ncbi:hypothetical protein Y1Q_0016877 [Alligator mississippiensis]|uniref:Uncharacterized protein n=1 Tax=Alligator mississippiensis TaxID=8496 RepID=A0A151P719_ALLMI|nr:hypothetical protein Y1Q_0016877 [Alligator mississippiensis]
MCLTARVCGRTQPPRSSSPAAAALRPSRGSRSRASPPLGTQKKCRQLLIYEALYDNKPLCTCEMEGKQIMETDFCFGLPTSCSKCLMKIK